MQFFQGSCLMTCILKHSRLSNIKDVHESNPILISGQWIDLNLKVHVNATTDKFTCELYFCSGIIHSINLKSQLSEWKRLNNIIFIVALVWQGHNDRIILNGKRGIHTKLKFDTWHEGVSSHKAQPLSTPCTLIYLSQVYQTKPHCSLWYNNA